MRCYRVEFLNDDGDLIIDFVNADALCTAHEIAQKMAGHKYYKVTAYWHLA